MVDPLELAREQLSEIAAASTGTVQVSELGTVGGTNDTTYGEFEVSVRFDGLDRSEGGLRVRARETFRVVVPPAFPFEHPTVNVRHDRFAGFNHVQGRGRLCLYRSSVDWCPEGGMYGFVERLDAWIRDAAVNNLDPDDAPLHPPVAYEIVDRLFVPKADTPIVDGTPWFGLAELRSRGDRTEIVGWKEPSDEPPDHYALALLLHTRLPFEYPKSVQSLLTELESHGLSRGSFTKLLSLFAGTSAKGTPLVLVLGSPMRRPNPGGRHIQHLAVWQVSAADADKLRDLSRSSPDGSPVKQSASAKAVDNWADSASVGWCVVREMRPEVTNRRDQESPMGWFRGKRVTIWGCGAIGTHVADSVVRAGAASVELVDNKNVAPGILVRQCFDDADIGKPKAKALAARLKRINPDLDADPSSADLIARVTGPNPLPMVDLLIDCTASQNLRMAVENTLRDFQGARPPIASISIDNRASAGMATLSREEHSGGTFDLVRRLKLETCRNPQLAGPLEAFWPAQEPDKEFQPEPGCSEPTFVGSNADLAGLSARMLNRIAHALHETDETYTGFGWLCEDSGPVHDFSWGPETVLMDNGLGCSVRISATAEREMRGWARRSARINGPHVETGGLVFGELNEAAGVLWVTEVEGPPPDSCASEEHFTCGVEGMEEVRRIKRSRYRRSVENVGSWHTHPSSPPYPSETDVDAATQLVTDEASARKTWLVLILTMGQGGPSLGAHVFRRPPSQEGLVQYERDKTAIARSRPRPRQPRNVGLALSGGGARAIAFHLGCLRALHDLELLDRLQVISSVSGGSVIAAMYAYSDEEFAAFEARVIQLLRRGLRRDICRRLIRPRSICKLIRVWIDTVPSCIAQSLQCLYRLVVPRSDGECVNVPPERRFSRTQAFKEYLADSMFGDTIVRDVSRESLETVINATELRTGSAFRFGSTETGCWRFGVIEDTDALVADAVAASAAYPAALPALDRKYCFRQNGQVTEPIRVLLTDGGVFENLGVSPMEPGRSPAHSTNVFKPDYIICCDAGEGLFDDNSYPTCWPTRMYRSFLSVFRKVQDATRNRLHYFANDGKIKGFALCYLGQMDKELPWIPANLPRRDEVRHYPTDFEAMSEANIELLARRGEILTRLFVAHYLSDI